MISVETLSPKTDGLPKFKASLLRALSLLWVSGVFWSSFRVLGMNVRVASLNPPPSPQILFLASGNCGWQQKRGLQLSGSGGLVVWGGQLSRAVCFGLFSRVLRPPLQLFLLCDRDFVGLLSSALKHSAVNFCDLDFSKKAKIESLGFDGVSSLRAREFDASQPRKFELRLSLKFPDLTV